MYAIDTLLSVEVPAKFALPVFIVLPAVFAALLSAFCFYMLWWRRLRFKKGVPSNEKWSPCDEFCASDVQSVEKKDGKDFVILTLADIQVHDLFRLDRDRIICKTIKSAVERAKPDLIVLLGDNCWGFSRQCYARLVKIMDGFAVPWAPVFGNHDMEGNADLYLIANILEGSKYCLFRQGPRTVTGIGNYAVNIKSGEKVVHTLFFFDTGTWQIDYAGKGYIPADEQAASEIPAYYAERITEGKHADEILIGDTWGTLAYQQMDYYEWMLNGIARQNGGKVPPSSIFVHIPLYEYNDAYFEWLKNGRDPAVGFGEINEKICSPADPLGVFDRILSAKSTQTIVCGHDHENNFSAEYRGVRLSYSLKCADECSWREYLNGGSVLTVDDDGKASFSHLYVKPEGKRHGQGLLGRIFH